MKRPNVYRRIDGERDYQDIKWGGKDHDLFHKPNDWLGFIANQVIKGLAESSGLGKMARIRKIAGLAVAAMETTETPERR